MYAKLVFRNAKRSVKDYLIYIVTMTICVTLFYSFLSISSRYYQPDIGSEYNFTILSDGMKAAICVITLFLLFLIRFVNHYMLRRKQKEFAVQSIMGMEQKTVGRLFFAETFMMGILSIAIGIFLGVFCSQFITAMLLTTYGKSYELSWTLFPDTVLLTIGFFIFSFLIVGIFNTRTKYLKKNNVSIIIKLTEQIILEDIEANAFKAFLDDFFENDFDGDNSLKEKVRNDYENIIKENYELLEGDLLTTVDGTIRHDSLKLSSIIFHYLMK